MAMLKSGPNINAVHAPRLDGHKYTPIVPRFHFPALTMPRSQEGDITLKDGWSIYWQCQGRTDSYTKNNVSIPTVVVRASNFKISILGPLIHAAIR